MRRVLLALAVLSVFATAPGWALYEPTPRPAIDGSTVRAAPVVALAHDASTARSEGWIEEVLPGASEAPGLVTILLLLAGLFGLTVAGDRRPPDEATRG